MVDLLDVTLLVLQLGFLTGTHLCSMNFCSIQHSQCRNLFPSASTELKLYEECIFQLYELRSKSLVLLMVMLKGRVLERPLEDVSRGDWLGLMWILAE